MQKVKMADLVSAKKRILSQIHQKNLSPLIAHNEIYTPNSCSSGVWKFRSASEMVKYANQELKRGRSLARYMAKRDTISQQQEFFGCESLQHAQNMFYNPPEYVREANNEIQAEIEKCREDNQVQYQYDVAGFNFDVGTYLSGIPECWISEGVEIAEQKSIELFINAVLPSKSSNQAFMQKAKNVVFLVDYLQSKGYNIKISYLSVADSWVIYFPIKDYNEQLDINTFFYCCTAIFTRAIGFNLLENVTDVDKYLGSASYIEAANVINIQNIYGKYYKEFVEDFLEEYELAEKREQDGIKALLKCR